MNEALLSSAELKNMREYIYKQFVKARDANKEYFLLNFSKCSHPIKNALLLELVAKFPKIHYRAGTDKFQASSNILLNGIKINNTSLSELLLSANLVKTSYSSSTSALTIFSYPLIKLPADKTIWSLYSYEYLIVSLSNKFEGDLYQWPDNLVG